MGPTLVKTDTNKYNEQIKANITQISQRNKPQTQNKHFAYLVLSQFWDRPRGPNKVGSTILGVKQKVQNYSLVGGGLKGTKNNSPKPLYWPQTTTKGGGVQLSC